MWHFPLFALLVKFEGLRERTTQNVMCRKKPPRNGKENMRKSSCEKKEGIRKAAAAAAAEKERDGMEDGRGEGALLPRLSESESSESPLRRFCITEFCLCLYAFWLDNNHTRTPKCIIAGFFVTNCCWHHIGKVKKLSIEYFFLKI